MKVINDVVLTGDASVNITGDIIDAYNIQQVSLQYVSTGASTGTIKLQVSNDIVNPINWSDLSGATVVVAAASNGIIPKTDIAYRWLRPFYTKNNGSAGTVAVIIKTNG